MDRDQLGPYKGAAYKQAPFTDGLLPKDRLENVQIKGRSIPDGPQKLDCKTIQRLRGRKS